MVFCSNVGEQKDMSGEDVWYCAWCGMWVYCSVLFSMDMLLSCALIYVPLMLFWLWSYQVVSLALKSPTINACRILPSWC